MLVLSRHKDEAIVINENIRVVVLDGCGKNGKVRLGIEAPRDVTVHREEVFAAIQQERAREKDREN